MFLYHGNSGCPLLAGKNYWASVFGATFEDVLIDDKVQLYYRKPRFIFIKSGLIFGLLSAFENAAN
jgi:hypothetical protein